MKPNITRNGVIVDYIEDPLTKEEVQQILISANLAVREGKSYSYRFGQAIYNELPSRVAYPINGTDQDMFHIKDEDLATTMLLNLAEKM